MKPSIVGRRTHHGGDAGPANWPPIIDRATWLRVAGRLADASRKRRSSVRSYMLTGLVESSAGESMVGHPQQGRRTYFTPWRQDAEQPAPAVFCQIDADDLEGVVVEATLRLLDDVVIAPDDDTDTELQTELDRVEADMQALAVAHGDGLLTTEQFLTANAGHMARRAQLSARRPPTRRGDVSRLLAAKGAARAAWPTLAVEQRRQLLGAVIDRIVIEPADRTRRGWQPERVDIAWKA